MPTNNYYIAPSDGWVQVADAPSFVRTSGVPHTAQYYLYSGSSAPSQVPTSGSGTVTFSTAVPTAGDTVTIGSETYTFAASRTTAFTVAIGANFTASAQNLKAAIGLDSTLVTASGAGAVITVTSIAAGSQGNLALSKSGTNIAVSGAALTGGTDVTQGILMCHHPFKVNVTMTEKLFARVVTPQADGQKFRLDVFTI
jgi:phage tail sheath gpL-like